MMKTATIARLYFIACSQLLGEFGQSAIYHLGSALALRQLENTLEDDERGFDREFEIARHISDAFRIFRRARNAKCLVKGHRYDPKPSGGCRSSECEGAYLRVE